MKKNKFLEVKAINKGNWSFQSSPTIGLIYKERVFNFYRGGAVTCDDSRPFLKNLLQKLQTDEVFIVSLIPFMNEMIDDANHKYKKGEIIDLWRTKGDVRLCLYTNEENAQSRADKWREAKGIANWNAD